MNRDSQWKKFHRWEEEYDVIRLRKLTPVEKIKLGEELYQTVVRVLRETQFEWNSDKEAIDLYKKFFRMRA
ncbi:hypothetical protein IIA15_05750 [candidate division TA06 bacterium]|nr:hypothetical protein [candidate division TA06 bacterium]